MSTPLEDIWKNKSVNIISVEVFRSGTSGTSDHFSYGMFFGVAKWLNRCMWRVSRAAPVCIPNGTCDYWWLNLHRAADKYWLEPTLPVSDAWCSAAPGALAPLPFLATGRARLTVAAASSLDISTVATLFAVASRRPLAALGRFTPAIAVGRRCARRAGA